MWPDEPSNQQGNAQPQQFTEQDFTGQPLRADEYYQAAPNQLSVARTKRQVIIFVILAAGGLVIAVALIIMGLSTSPSKTLPTSVQKSTAKTTLPDKSSSSNTGQQSTPQAAAPKSLLPYPANVSSTEFKFTANDQQRYTDMQYGMRFRISAISGVTGKHPANVAEIMAYYPKYGVKYTMENDPTTGKPYVLTDNTPKRGEVQYVNGYGCDSVKRGLGSPTSPSDFAIVIMLDDNSFWCTSAIKG